MDWVTTDIGRYIDSLPEGTPVEYRISPNAATSPLDAEKVRRGVVYTPCSIKYVGSKSRDGWRGAVTHIRVVPSSAQPPLPSPVPQYPLKPASAGPSDESPAEALSSGVPSMARLVTTIVTFTPPATKENPNPQTQVLREPVTEVAVAPIDNSIVSRIAVKEVPGLAAKHKIPDDQLNLIRIEYISQPFNEVRIAS